MDMQASVTAFHKPMQIPVGGRPNPLALDRLKLRLGLFDEFFELLAASGMRKSQVKLLEFATKTFIEELDSDRIDQDIVEMADALGDIVVVAFGMAIEMGVDLNRVLAEIMRANMSKLDEHGNPLINVCPQGGKDCLNLDHLPDQNQPKGKVLKASGYTPPNIAAMLESQEPLG